MPRLFKTGFAFFLLLFFFPSDVFAQVVINEFLPAPSSGNPEWVEFFNPASASADLSDYFFDDDKDFGSDSGSSPKVALSGVLPSQLTCYWELTSFLNNNGDTPTLFISDGTIADFFGYTSSQTDKSYGRVPDGGEWQSNLAPSKSLVKCQSLIPAQVEEPTLPPAATVEAKIEPQISVTLGNSFNLGTPFSLSLKLEKFEAEHEYFLKFRAGLSESSLGKGQTQRGEAFYADNESWLNFPQIKTDRDGKWEGPIIGRVGEDKPPGKYFIRVRIRKKDTETFFDSNLNEAEFLLTLEPAAETKATAAAIMPLEPDKNEQGSTSSEIENFPEILGTASAIRNPQNQSNSAKITPGSVKPPQGKENLVLIISGLVIVVLSLSSLLLRKIRVRRV